MVAAALLQAPAGGHGTGAHGTGAHKAHKVHRAAPAHLRKSAGASTALRPAGAPAPVSGSGPGGRTKVKSATRVHRSAGVKHSAPGRVSSPPSEPNAPPRHADRGPATPTAKNSRTKESGAGAPAKAPDRAPRSGGPVDLAFVLPTPGRGFGVLGGVALTPGGLLPFPLNEHEFARLPGFFLHGGWADESLRATSKLRLPLSFLFAATIFILVQALIDRRDPKVVRAPEHQTDDSVGFE
jgi:hypothetical protein